MSGASARRAPALALPIARVLPLLTPAHLDRDFDYLVPPEFDEIAQPGVRVRIRFAGRLVDGYLLDRLASTDHTGKLVPLDRVVSAERVLTPEILRLVNSVAARYAGSRADVLRLAIPPRHARTENGGPAKPKTAKAATKSAAEEVDAPAVAPHDTMAARADEDIRSATTATEGTAAQRTQDNPESAKPGGIPNSGVSTGDSSSSAALKPTGGPVGAASGEEDGDGGRAGTDRAGAAQHSSPSAARSPKSPENEAIPTTAAPSPDMGRSNGPGLPPVSVEPNDLGVSHGPERPRASNRPNDLDTAQSPGGAPAEPHAPEAMNPAELVDRVGVDLAPWNRYLHGASFLEALAQGRGVRAAWQALPGEQWAARLAELAAVVVAGGRSAVLMVPDQRDLDRVLAECQRLVGERAVGLSAGLGPAARYRRWLAVLRGSATVVVGTRAAVFAPARELGLIAIWDDGDDTYAEPRAPYPHAREVAMLRAHETGAAFVAGGFARTAEIQAVVDSGWAHDLVADRATLRSATPRISAPGDTDLALERDPVARAVRIPGAAFAAARSALKEGAGVLVQVPRRGYVPALACGKCRTPARCRHCNGPLALPDRPRQAGPESADIAHSPACRWCGRTEAGFRCAACGSRALRAVVIGATRTAEELGRAFPGVPIRGSGGGAVLDTVEPGPQVVVATVGAEPVLPGGYGVALLLDGWALLGRADLRAAEDALRRWMTAAALVRAHGQVLVMAEPSIPTVQALIRWDPIGHARAEVDSRAEVGFPPAVRMAAIDGTAEAITELLAAATLPDSADLLGPVPLPPFARKPFTGDSPAEVERVLLRTPRHDAAALSRALSAAQAVRSAQRSDAPLRVQIDPIDIG
ncbi:primosomal protein N' [Nocardia cyriacigeorgica]|uniref:primosomal protein N' n=2 Tax=Nocardia cyriacigeorgica TaxID=135487 RepID=UPI002B4B4A87|nr:primosomal protein N' [Nocardia cyriacigeorgica]